MILGDVILGEEARKRRWMGYGIVVGGGMG